MTDSLKTKQKIQRAKTEKMYLLSQMSTDDFVASHFIVEGSKGTEYKIVFDNSGVKCTCPSFTFNHKICKHIYFIINRVCKLDFDTDSKDTNVFEMYPDILNILSNLTKKTDAVAVGPNEDCCICYDSMNETAVVTCMVCKNCIHDSCMKVWSKSSRGVARETVGNGIACPLCRSPIVLNDVLNDPLSKLKI